ncbi:BppU family phage baseplate upper protein [Enterococcus durans]|uniref:BppU family phage baseplate upper protein n=1 Tax=Enterococcus durans TaxID=53345 RepID=UPI0039A5797B
MAHVIKKDSITVSTQPKDYDLQATGLVFKSYDNQIALEFNVEQQNGTPADLLGANLRLLMFIYDEVDGMITKEPIPFITKNLITESFLNGQVVYILPEAMKAYNGMVEAYVYIEYPDGSTSDNLGFTFRMKRSAIDGLAQDKADYFIADFQQLLDGVKQEATDAVNEVLAKVEAVSKNVSSAQNDLTILEDRIDQTNQQIGELGQLKRMYSNSIDFGGKGSSLSDFLDAPYYLSKVPLQENIANTAVQFPISSSKYTLYSAKMQEPFVVGNTYTITLEGTKPSTQVFRVYGQSVEDYNYGSMEPVRGLVNTWSLTFTPSKVSQDYPTLLQIIQQPDATIGACTINWLKIEKGETRTPNISQFKYFGEGLKDSDNPNDYSWDITPEYAEKSLNNTVSLTEPQTVLGLKNFSDGIQIAGDRVVGENEHVVYTLDASNSKSFIDGYATFIKHGKTVIANGTVKFKKTYPFGTTLEDVLPDEFVAKIVHGMLTGPSGTSSVSKAMYVRKDLGTIITNSEFVANEWFTFHGNYWVGEK